MLSRTHRWVATALALPAIALTSAATTPDAAASGPGGDLPAAATLDRPPTGPLEPIADHVPSAADRFSLANGCFALYSPTAGAFVTRAGDGFTASATTVTDAETFHFQAFDLGKYLLFGSEQDFLAAAPGPIELIDEGTDDGRNRLPVREDTDLPRSVYDDLPDVDEPTLAPPSTRTGEVTAAAAPSARAEWIVRNVDGGGFTFHLPVDDRSEEDPGPADVGTDAPAPTAATLVAADDGTLNVVEVADDAARFTLKRAAAVDCASWEEIELNVGPEDEPAELVTGTHPADEVRGYLDAHLHMMAFEFIGGRSRCGRPWHPYGVAYALVDCPDHEPGGAGAALEMFLGGPPTHDTTGWPEFGYWPRYDSLTHEQVYYRWMERAWRGGLRMFTNLLVDNNSLCEAWVYKENSCNEMDGVRLQAERLQELERYIDAQWGGPGEGWFRIVTDPFEARRAINEGRLAVVMGIEVSVLFDCGIVAGVAQCDSQDIDEELAAVHELGVRQLEFANKFDNALTGVTGDAGETGMVVNTGNFADTGQFWQMRTCPDDHEHQHDKTQLNLNDDAFQGNAGPFTERDGIFGAVLQLSGQSGLAPVYPEGPHCNVRGLTDLGRYLLGKMVERGMLFDPDHMSSLGRQQALDYLQARDYSGVVSSHSWADDSVYERVLEMGGVVTPYAGDSEDFIHTWRKTRSWADDRFLFGIGYGADTNGFGSQGAPRNPTDDGSAVEYPFEGFGGALFDEQQSGEQTYDINTDGVDHYGLYPDWIEDIRVQLDADGEADDDAEAFREEMSRGPEAYLQMWERALGIANDACRDDRVAGPTAADLDSLPPGMSATDVLVALGQPRSRTEATFTYCTAEGKGATVSFDDHARLADVTHTDDHPGKRPAEPGRGDRGPSVAAAASIRHDRTGHPHGPTALATAPAAAVSSPASTTTRVALLAVGLAGLATAALRRRRPDA
jgi:hypothetical protein